MCFIVSSLSDFHLESIIRLAYFPVKSAVILARIQELPSFLDKTYNPLIKSLFPYITALQLSVEQSRESLPQQINAMKILVPYMVEALLNNPDLRVGTVWIGTNDANTDEELEACIPHYRALHEALSAWSDEKYNLDDIGTLIHWIRQRGLTQYALGGNGTPSGIIHRFSNESDQKALHIAMSLRKRREKQEKWSDKKTIIQQLHQFASSWSPSTSGWYFSGNLVNIHHSPDTFLSKGDNPSWLTTDEYMILLGMAQKTGLTQAKIDFLSGSI